MKQQPVLAKNEEHLQEVPQESEHGPEEESKGIDDPWMSSTNVVGLGIPGAKKVRKLRRWVGSFYRLQLIRGLRAEARKWKARCTIRNGQLASLNKKFRCQKTASKTKISFLQAEKAVLEQKIHDLEYERDTLEMEKLSIMGPFIEAVPLCLPESLELTSPVARNAKTEKKQMQRQKTGLRRFRWSRENDVALVAAAIAILTEAQSDDVKYSESKLLEMANERCGGRFPGTMRDHWNYLLGKHLEAVEGGIKNVKDNLIAYLPGILSTLQA